MADSLQVIRDAVDELMQTITTELDELAALPQINPADVQAVADSIRAQGARVKDMVPTPEPPPVP
jgi:hypothetical protein